MVQMIVSLGLLPNLLPGIGLAPDKRSNFLQAVFQVNKYGICIFSGALATYITCKMWTDW
jgi:hypothetical protein